MTRDPEQLAARDDGAVAVEFALVSLLFFMILFGIITFGLLFALNHTLTHAAAEGARSALAAAAGDEASSAQEAALSRMGWLGEGATVAPPTIAPCASDPTHECITVVTRYDLEDNPLIVPMPGLGLALPDVISRQAVLQLSQVPAP